MGRKPSQRTKPSTVARPVKAAEPRVISAFLPAARRDFQPAVRTRRVRRHTVGTWSRRERKRQAHKYFGLRPIEGA